MVPSLSRSRLRRVLLGPDVAVAFAVLAVLYVAMEVPFPPTQVPGYLLVVAYDLVEVAIPALTPYWPVGFPAFLYLLAVVGAAVGRVVRDDGGWPASVGTALLVVGGISLLFASLLGIPLALRGDVVPGAITGTVGVVLVALGAWLLRR